LARLYSLVETYSAETELRRPHGDDHQGENCEFFKHFSQVHLLQLRKPAWKERINKSADLPVSWQLIAAVLSGEVECNSATLQTWFFYSQVKAQIVRKIIIWDVFVLNVFIFSLN
jgi:hypothetical protein